MKRHVLSALFLTVSVLSTSVFASEIVEGVKTDSASIEAKLPKKKLTIAHHYLTPKQSYDIKKNGGKNVLFVDIRSPAELQFVGHAVNIDGNVPYITFDYSDWDKKKKTYKSDFNSGFVGQVEDLMKKTGINHGKNTEIILMCRSGDRSARAADLMKKNGYTNVWSAYEGFEGDKAKSGENKGKRVVNGWKNAGLPWTYKLDKDKTTFIF
ncbi:rhodanese-like domain-containing protein [Thiomicrorhabdus sp.]|uniref:rhodanese-like domain-containing protein n=1 Tax=Thiomicrorhabdus sp. TaxID=2039724 RepID=UPI002AA8C852|nr:rhodanese-like domain-containing protein [Thiomicrorhabdus sp.]